MSRILVTGGAGRLGRSVVRLLAESGHDVVSVDRSTADLPAREIEADLLDAQATAALFARIEPDAVVHLAAIAVPGALPDPEIFAVNTRLTWNVLEASIASSVSALLVASSPTVIGYGAPGWKPAYLPLDEDHPRKPWNGYSVSKVAIEEIIQMAARRHGDRMRFGLFRPCYVIAPEEWEGAATQQGHTVAERLADPALSAVALFNYLDARDAADFVRTWIESTAEVPNGEVFFVTAPDALVDLPTAEALRSHVPGTADAAASLTGSAGVFSGRRAAELLGWRARRTWRTELSTARTDEQESAHA